MIHPCRDPSFETQAQYYAIKEAYDKIMLYRIAEQGIPMLRTDEYYPFKSHTKVIQDFRKYYIVDENDFKVPHVSVYYEF